jgi:hypothetical protein
MINFLIGKVQHNAILLGLQIFGPVILSWFSVMKAQGIIKIPGIMVICPDLKRDFGTAQFRRLFNYLFNQFPANPVVPPGIGHYNVVDIDKWLYRKSSEIDKTIRQTDILITGNGQQYELRGMVFQSFDQLRFLHVGVRNSSAHFITDVFIHQCDQCITMSRIPEITGNDVNGFICHFGDELGFTSPKILKICEFIPK